MDKAFYETADYCKLIKVGTYTLHNIMAYSKSLNITKVGGIQYESNLN